MKKLTLTLPILCALGAFAYAGPEPYSGKDMKQVVPVPPPCQNWTGFYVGGFAGYKFGVGDTNLDLRGDWLQIPGFEALEAANSQDLGTSGFEAGGVIGYNYQFNKWVVGVEASGAYLWLNDSYHFDGLSVSNTYDGDTSLKTHYLATFGPRLGYAFCKWLPYITGGVAFGDIDFRQEFFIPVENGIFNQGGSTSEDQVGWMVGGGLQYAIADHWSVRGQYQFVDLGSVSFDSAFSTNPTYTGHHEASLREHNASFAIIYGF